MGDVPIEQAQPSNGDPKRACEDPWTSDRTRRNGAVTQGKCVREIQVYLNDPRSQSEEARSGTHGRENLITLVYLINPVGSSHHICRDVEGAGKCTLEVYDTVAEAHHV